MWTKKRTSINGGDKTTGVFAWSQIKAVELGVHNSVIFHTVCSRNINAQNRTEIRTDSKQMFTKGQHRNQRHGGKQKASRAI